MAKIRPLERRDIEYCIPLAQAMQEESPRYSRYKFSVEKARMMFEHFARIGGAFVAEDDGVLVGMAGSIVAEPVFSTDRYVVDIGVYVDPDWRGGTIFLRLVRAIEAWAREQPGVLDDLFGVSTGVRSAETVQLYEKLGYTVTSYCLIKARP